MTKQPNDYSAPWAMHCERGWISVVDNRGREVCYLEAYDEEDQDRQLANARLIKLAPKMRDLLGMIKELLELNEYISQADELASEIRKIFEIGAIDGREDR